MAGSRPDPGHRHTMPDEHSDDFAHEPVMVDEVLEALRPVPAGIHVDATVGGGGHAAAVLADRPVAHLVGIDRDPRALAAARRRLAPHADRVTLVRATYDRLADEVGAVAGRLDLPVTSVLFDLGVSSPQLDHPERGFSYRHRGPLDMRMDPDSSLTADEIVNTWDARAIADLLRRHADERFAGRIARAIVTHRPVADTVELAEIVRDAIPAPARRRGGHPARRTFQALRIAVNDELTILDRALEQALDLLAPQGRCVVLAYHSGEDRIVKRRFRDAAGEAPPPRPGLPPPPGIVPVVRHVWRGARTPSRAEVERNPRAEAARLRAVEKLEPEGATPGRGRS